MTYFKAEYKGNWHTDCAIADEFHHIGWTVIAKERTAAAAHKAAGSFSPALELGKVETRVVRVQGTLESATSEANALSTAELFRRCTGGYKWVPGMPTS